MFLSLHTCLYHTVFHLGLTVASFFYVRYHKCKISIITSNTFPFFCCTCDLQMVCYSGRDVQLPEITRNPLNCSTPHRFPSAWRKTTVITVSSHANYELPQAFLCSFITIRPVKSNSRLILLSWWGRNDTPRFFDLNYGESGKLSCFQIKCYVYVSGYNVYVFRKKHPNCLGWV